MIAASLNVRNVSKKYLLPNRQSIEVLCQVNLTVSPGDWIILAGRSGCGKTTLLQILGILDEPSGGSVEYFGRNTTKMSFVEKARLRRLHIGFIFQSYQLFPELNALENVLLPGRLDGRNIKYLRERAMFLLAEVGMNHRTYHHPTELSGGEQQRIAIARSLMNEPDILLADEPTGNLDDKNSDDIMAILQNLHQKKGKTIIMVTHNHYLKSFADRVYILEDGRLSVTAP